MEKTLQSLYDTCNWQGYATYKGERVYRCDVQRMAKEAGIELEYNCPA